MSNMLPGLSTTGYLGIIMGPMYSGKTSKLIELYKQYTLCGVKITVINYEGDTRYNSSALTTHDGHTIPCLWENQLSNLENNPQITQAKVILINEGQFFSDIVPWVTRQVEQYEKIVFICGLEGDFKCEKFGTWLELIPLSDEVTKLTSLCTHCKSNAAIFSHRLTKEIEQILIGTSQYIPVCRHCYKLLNCTLSAT